MKGLLLGRYLTKLSPPLSSSVIGTKRGRAGESIPFFHPTPLFAGKLEGGISQKISSPSPLAAATLFKIARNAPAAGDRGRKGEGRKYREFPVRNAGNYSHSLYLLSFVIWVLAQRRLLRDVVFVFWLFSLFRRVRLQKTWIKIENAVTFDKKHNIPVLFQRKKYEPNK